MASAVQGSRQGILVEGQSDEPHDELSCPARRRLRAQEARLGQQLRDELAPRRAEREPYRHLGRPNGGPRQQQVRDVGARDQENHGGDTEEEKPAFLERPSRPPRPRRACIVSGTNTMAGMWRAVPRKPAGATPTMVIGSPLAPGLRDSPAFRLDDGQRTRQGIRSWS